MTWGTVVGVVSTILLIAPTLVGLGYMISMIRRHDRRLDVGDRRFEVVQDGLMEIKDDMSGIRKDFVDGMKNGGIRLTIRCPQLGRDITGVTEPDLAGD